LTEEGTFEVNVKQDNDARNPRTEWDNASHQLFSHKRYDVGDEGLWGELGINSNDFNSWKEVAAWLYKTQDVCCGVVVRGYDHGGLTISAADEANAQLFDRWDSGIIGIAYMTKAQVRECYMIKRITQEYKDKALSLIKGEIKSVDDWLTDNVFGYTIEHESETMEDDSCWGYYGDPQESGLMDEVISHIKGSILSLKEKRLARYNKQFAKLKAQIKNKVPLGYRKEFVL
jgi:hypothetical protein